ncbi:MAG: transposase [Oscillospiraceae bacterium]|nr:transposase [Oscillospiraceae bacterium]
MSDLPVRKTLRLRNYDYSQNGAYFITICNQNRRAYFTPEASTNNVGADRCVRPGGANEIIRYWLGEIPRHFPNTAIDSFAIMPDHIHFILRIDRPCDTGAYIGPSLQKMMQWFKTMTTNEYTKAVKAGLLPPYEGRLWQRGYYEHVIRNDADYLECWSYIEGNPVK